MELNGLPASVRELVVEDESGLQHPTPREEPGSILLGIRVVSFDTCCEGRDSLLARRWNNVLSPHRDPPCVYGRRRRSWLALLLVGVVLVTAAAPLAGAAAVASADSKTAPADRGRAAQEDPSPTATATNNSTRHENPDEAGEDGDLSRVERYLVGKLAAQLAGSSLQLSQGEYEQARRLLGDDYNEQLGKYVDVAGETETADSLERAQNDQREYAEAVQSYQQTFQEYQEARENGNETRARELARQLQRQHDRVVRLNDSVTAAYDGIENGTDADLTDAERNIETTTQNVTDLQTEVVDTFERTELTVTADAATVSFDDPTTLSGQLTTENGTPVADRPITLVVGNDTVETTTDGAGEFAVDYRPVFSPANQSSLTVQYVPAVDSIYFNSSTTVDLTVEQTTANVSVTEVSDAVAFGDDLTVAGRVAVDGDPVDGVPVVVTVDGAALGSVRTNADGTFSLTTAFPATVPTGTQSVVGDVALSDRAITGDAGSADLTVEETATELSISGEQRSDGVSVSGRLETATGEGVAGQSVDLTVDGTTVASVTTDAAGHFETTLSLPTDVGEAVRVTANYADAGTNLADARASTVVTISDDENASPGAGGGPTGKDGVLERIQSATSNLLLVAAGLLLVALLGVVAVTRWWGSSTADESEATAGMVTEATSESVDRSRRLLEAAQRYAAEQGDQEAVTAAYAAARRAVTSNLGVSSAGTHWEVYQRVRDRGSGDLSERFRRLTESYEATQYAGVLPDADRVRGLLEDAGIVVEQTGDESEP